MQGRNRGSEGTRVSSPTRVAVHGVPTEPSAWLKVREKRPVAQVAVSNAKVRLTLSVTKYKVRWTKKRRNRHSGFSNIWRINVYTHATEF